ncbi:MAG TPA: hypothetical protein VL371_09830 [Gemmataceae bacterium]|jgi:uncharacterized protein (DUF433 family)|nr:hypothetical protein [Gemmataceae bacterium]
MSIDFIDDRGCIVGTRLSVQNLLPEFLDPTKTEGLICRLYHLTAEQVSAARAYMLNHADTILAEHLRIEDRVTAGNPPEVIERAEKTRATLMKFKEWLVERDRIATGDAAADAAAGAGHNGAGGIPSFREWLAEQESRPEAAS